MSEELEHDELLENMIMKFLYTDEKLRDKIIPYLRFSIFDEPENMTLIKFAKKFITRYGKFPNPKETRLKLKDADAVRHLKNVLHMDTSEYSTEMMIGEAEEFIRQRCIMDVCYKVVEQVNNDEMEGIGAIPDEMREAVAFAFDNNVGLDVFDEESEQKIYDQLHNSDVVVSTGLQTIDDLIEGGTHEKTLTLIMAETNMGKSLIMGALATNNVFAGKKVLYITCEMSEFKIGERILQNSFDMSAKDIKRLPRNKFGQAFSRARENMAGKFVVKEYPTGVCTTNHIRNVLKELQLKKKFVPDIIYIDYIGIMASTFTNKSDNTYNVQKRITEEVRGLAVELALPIVSAIQTNRSGMGEDELDLTNVSDSIGTAFTADIMIGVTQSEELRNAFKYRWTIIKNRYGPNKVGVTVKVDYNKMRLSDDGIVTEEPEDDRSSSEKKKTSKKASPKNDVKTKPRNRKINRLKEKKDSDKIQL